MKVPEQYRVTRDTKLYGFSPGTIIYTDFTFGNYGNFVVPRKGKKTGYYFMVVASEGLGWDHVSVTIIVEKRCPTWEEMCYIKDLFWDKEDCVLQYHPPHSENVSMHPYCLHLWRPQGVDFPVPDSLLVGLKNMKA